MELSLAGLSVGCNAVTHVVSWSSSGVLAFGANRSIAIYDPRSNFGVSVTLFGHKDRVTAVRWISSSVIVSGSSDSTLRVWHEEFGSWICTQIIDDHQKSISALAVCEDRIVSGAMDGSLKVYRFLDNSLKLEGNISFKPFLPLAIAIARIPSTGSFMIAIGGTTTRISLCTVSIQDAADGACSINLVARLPGHEDWIRSFAFTEDRDGLLLASASQDRYIRLWRISQKNTQSASEPIINGLDDLVLLENKTHDFIISESSWKVAFEALLVSHEDWVFSVDFSRDSKGAPLLLSSSADSSIIIWSPDVESEIWTVKVQLGTISTKGASTATGSTGGFWGALFSPMSLQDKYICAWNKTGSVRVWLESQDEAQAWRNIGGVGGHVKEVRSLSWSPGGEYFLTTSLDQSTRLWAKHRDGSWKEFARPQIHGYDIQSIHVMSPALFISGAEEKIVRIFQATSSVVDMLARVAGIDFRNESTAEAANVPALGLSNKALTSANQGTHLDRSDLEETLDKDDVPLSKAMLDALTTPPTEDHLQRHTLFPELEKLYGHGYEIQALSASHDGRFIITGCRATTPSHAMLRLYDAATYKELAVLEGHSLTATKARFSTDDRFILSVSRDRSLCLYKQKEDRLGYENVANVPKAHKRIIWDCAWLDATSFATASRDGLVILWNVQNDKIVKRADLEVGVAATAVAWACNNQETVLAVGLEDGQVRLYKYIPEQEDIAPEPFASKQICDAAITGLEFRSASHGRAITFELAYCSEDCSVGILNLLPASS